MNAPTRPVVRWFGGKWKLAPWIIAHFPPHRVYVEPFGGGGSVLIRKPRSYAEVYNDLDGEVVNLFRVLRDPDSAALLAHALSLTPYARDEYDDAYREAESSVDRARRLIVRSFLGQSSKGANQKSGFDARIKDDGYCARLSSFRAVPDQVDSLLERLRDVVIENCDGIELLARYDRPGVLAYLDPPYLGAAQYYAHKFSREKHRRLLGVALKLKSMVVISGYPDDMYDTMLDSWRRVEGRGFVDGGASGADSRRTEVLWINPYAADLLSPEHFTLVSV